MRAIAILALIPAALVLGPAATPAAAAQVVISLDTVTTSNCNEVWYELACALMFLPVESGDCQYSPGLCATAGYTGPLGVGVALEPARLSADLSAFQGIDSIQVPIFEGQAAGCTRAYLYAGSTLVDSQQSTVIESQTLTLSANGRHVDRLVIAGGQSYVLELRINGAGLAGSEPTTWGALKALY